MYYLEMYKSVILVTLLTIISASAIELADLRTYRIYSFDTNGKVCSPTGVKGKIELTERNRSAVLVTASKLNEQRFINFDCKFNVDATPVDVFSTIKKLFNKEETNLGLFAVVQYMDLRYDQFNDDCIDYVQFKLKGRNYGPRLCGKRNIGATMSNHGSADEISELAFVSETGSIDVHIFIDRRPIEPYEHLDLKIVFTAYRKCTLQTDFCSEKKCISREYFHDGLVNCPYNSCTDENCDNVAIHLENLVNNERPIGLDSEGPTTGTKVTIGAVTTLLVSFLVFIICVWCCKKWGKLCWSEECSNPQNDMRSNIRNTQPSRTIELENRSEPSVPTISPSAPSVDKDLPPSYDSLFPSH